jgi:hypothetical protein
VNNQSQPLPRYEHFEKNVLGNLIKDGTLIEKLNILEDDFYEERDKTILKAIKEMIAEGAPPGDIELRQYLQEKNMIDKIENGFYYIGDLVDNAVPHNLQHEVQELKRVENRRLSWKLGKKLTQGIENGIDDEEIEKIKRKISNIENGNSPFSLKTKSWDEFIGSDEPELEFVIPDLIPKGNLIILGGKPKVGKSLLGLLMALSVGLGEDLWDKQVTKGGVLLVSTEDGEVRLRKRIWRMTDTPNEYHPNFHFHVSECNLSDSKTLSALKSKILETKPDLVVLDPLINLFKKGELNSAEDMNRVLRPLQDLAKETGAAILVIHHARKSGSEDSIDTIQGSITISGVADGILILKSLRSEGEGKKAVLEVILKDAEIPKKVVLSLDDNLRWNVEGDFEELEGMNLEQEVINALLEDDTGLSLKTLMDITGAEYKSLYRITMKLEKGGTLKSSKEGRYHTKLFFLVSRENDWKTKMENENQDVTNGKQREKCDDNLSFSKTLKVENEGKRKEIDPNRLCTECMKIKNACICN